MHDASYTANTIINQVLNNVTIADFSSSSSLAATYLSTVDSVIMSSSSFTTGGFSVNTNITMVKSASQSSNSGTISAIASHSLHRILTGVSPFTLSGSNNDNNGILIQVSVDLLFPPSPSQNNNINHYSVTKDAYKTEMENILMKSFVSGNFTKLFRKSCLNNCGNNQNTCNLCNRVSFSVPSFGSGSYGLSSTTAPTSVPTVPSDSISKANGIAAVFSSTTTLIGVVMGGLVMLFIFIWVVFYYYRRVKTDDTAVNELKDVYKIDSPSSSGYISKDESKNQSGFQLDFQGEVTPKQRDSLNKLQSIDFEYDFDRQTQFQDALSNSKNARKQNVDFDYNFNRPSQFGSPNYRVSKHKDFDYNNLWRDSKVGGMIDNDARSKLQQQLHEWNTNSKRNVATDFDKSFCFGDGFGKNRLGSVAFDLANPMAGRQVEPRKAHRPASNSLLNRYSAVFDYMETYLQRKSNVENSIVEIVESNPMKMMMP